MHTVLVERLHEYRMFCRTFREKLSAAGDRITAAVQSVVDPIIVHCGKRYRPRAEALQAAARAWTRTVPTDGQLEPPVIRFSSLV